MPLDWSPLWVGLRYAGLASLFSILVAVPLAWLLASRRFPGCELLDAAANLPLVVPPAVLIYYLLAASGRWSLRFSWHAAVALSALYSLPLFFRMTRTGLAAVDHSFENAARNLGAGEWRIFWHVTLPLAWRALAAAILAGFARAFVDFGATAFLASNQGERASWIWPIVPIAALALAAFYFGNRVRRGQVLA
jgi:molybdate transport system permease protein